MRTTQHLLITVCFTASAIACGTETGADGPKPLEYDAGEVATDLDAESDAATTDGSTTDSAAASSSGSDTSTTPTGPVSCDSDKDCFATAQVCHKDKTICVDCLTNDDCAAGKECRANRCDDPPTPCTSSKQCAAEGKVCDKAAALCLECAEDADCKAERYCLQGVCADDVCKLSDRKCKSKTEQLTCALNGSGWLASKCGEDFACDAGSCKKLVCTAGTSRCEGNATVTCDANGLGESAPSACAAGKQCIDGVCLDGVCKPGAKTCDGAILKACNATGTAWVNTACKSDPTGLSEICLDTNGSAKCVAQVCKPDTIWCDGTAVWACDDKGLSQAALVDCTEGGKKVATCIQAAGATAKCVDQLCEPGKTSCAATGNSVQTCAVDGMSYSGTTACGTSNVCVAGACKPQICTPQALFCAGDIVRKCDKTGTAATDQFPCALDGKVCSAGKCLPQLCTIGKNQCDAGKLKTCIDSGSGWQTSTCPAGTTCQDGACTSPLCEAWLTPVPNAGKADIIWFIDTSGSMSQEAKWLNTNLDKFAESLSKGGIDYRVVLVGTGLGLNPQLGKFLAPGSFLWVKKAIYSTDALKKLSPKGSNYINDFQSFLRPDAIKHWVAVTDDDSTQYKGSQFDQDVMAIDVPGTPGVKLFANYLFHSIVAWGPLAQKGCSTGARIGTEYLWLTAKTKGLQFKVCDADWTPFFNDIAAAVGKTATAVPGCEFAMPAAVIGKQPAIDKLTMTYVNAAGQKSPLPSVNGVGACASQLAYYYLPDKLGAKSLVLCPQACQTLDKSGLLAHFPCP